MLLVSRPCALHNCFAISPRLRGPHARGWRFSSAPFLVLSWLFHSSFCVLALCDGVSWFACLKRPSTPCHSMLIHTSSIFPRFVFVLRLASAASVLTCASFWLFFIFPCCGWGRFSYSIVAFCCGSVLPCVFAVPFFFIFFRAVSVHRGRWSDPGGASGVAANVSLLALWRERGRCGRCSCGECFPAKRFV